MFHRDFGPYYDVYNNGDAANDVSLYHFNMIIFNCKTSFKREFLCLYARASEASERLKIFVICMAQRITFL